MHEAILRPHIRTLLKKVCISQYNWYLIEQHTYRGIDPGREQLCLRCLGGRIRDNLRVDRDRQAEVAGGEIKTLLFGDSPFSKGSMEEAGGLVS